MTSNSTEGLVEALRAPSYQQDSAWHVAPFNYVTKPRALLSEAADRIEALERTVRREAEGWLSQVQASQARISELERDEGASNASRARTGPEARPETEAEPSAAATDRAGPPNWINIEAERVLYVDQGRETILCDRLPSPVTLLIKLADPALSEASK